MKTLLLLALCLASAIALPSSLGYFAGRSADIIIQSEDSSVQDSIIFLKGDQFSTTELNELEDTRFADLFAHVMGTQPFHIDADRTGFPTSSLFNKPKASAIVVIDSVGAEMLRKYPTLSLLQNGHAASISTKSIPANTITLLANLATGTSPSSHGIVGETWRRPVTGELVNAYDYNGLPFAANIADILLQETNGLSLVVSASGSTPFGSALAAHPELTSENLGWRAHAYGLNNNAFESRYEDPSCDQVLALSAADLEAMVQDVTVSVGNKQITFSAKSSEDFALLAELAFVRHIMNKLNSDSALSASVQDNIPDLYSFVFSSLKGIQKRYGAHSYEFAAALGLVDKSTEALLTTLNALYNGRVATAVAALNARDTSSERVKQVVHEKVSSLLYEDQDFAEYYPAIYVRTNDFVGYARDVMCETLQKAVGSGASVLCVSPFLPIRGLRAGNDTNGTNSSSASSNSDGPDNDLNDHGFVTYVWSFWIHFFMTLIIIGFVGWGVYCLAYVGSDASKDSLLFRATGRHQHQN
jgi:hypothetical protein